MIYYVSDLTKYFDPATNLRYLSNMNLDDKDLVLSAIKVSGREDIV
jgi:hypothetical protein